MVGCGARMLINVLLKGGRYHHFTFGLLWEIGLSNMV